MLKLVTFVPEAYAEIMRNTLFNAGAGSIGNYDACSYNLHGEGTFRANARCNPFCGEIGEVHVEKEVRMEMILPAFKKTAVTRALLSFTRMRSRLLIFIRYQTHGNRQVPV